MFYQAGWLPVQDVHHKIGRFVKTQLLSQDIEVADSERKQNIAREQRITFWALCMTAPSAGVLLHNGAIILVNRFFLMNFDVDQVSHNFFSVPEGIIGQGTLSRQHVLNEIEEETKGRWIRRTLNVLSPTLSGKRSGNLSFIKTIHDTELTGMIGSRMLFRESDFNGFLTKLEKETTEPVSERSCTKNIVAAHDRNETFSKTTAKSLYGQSLGARAFLRSWQAASLQRPELSRPGRPAERE